MLRLRSASQSILEFNLFSEPLSGESRFIIQETAGVSTEAKESEGGVPFGLRVTPDFGPSSVADLILTVSTTSVRTPMALIVYAVLPS